MEWQYIVAITVIVPAILFPAALVWYFNVSGLLEVMRSTREREKRRVARGQKARATAE